MASNETPVVGIGASAGGVDALQGLFGAMPTDTGVGFVVVTHLNPDRESHLSEILSRATAMPVTVAADGIKVEPDNIYVLPARAALGFSDGCLRMRATKAGTRDRQPIDVFLSALAIDKREFSAAIILSGSDSDGTLGVKAVKERGGLTMAQVADGHPPQHPDMPDSAISTGLVDFAIPVQEMGEKLAEFARSFSVLDGLALAAVKEDEHAAQNDALSEIYMLLRAQMGHDFSAYKTRTFLRRVQRRMQVNQAETFEDFVEILRRDPKEVSALFRDLLINVTSFFRDAEAFEALSETVIPRLFEGRGAEDTIRVWVPGCATGEEVFSIAMLLREHVDGVRNVPRIQLFATDIDERALSIARAARYPVALLDGVSQERRERFFVEEGGSFVVTKEIRGMCIFSPHSILRDPPFSRIDLVSCRNLLIYFGPDAQNQVVPTFRYALKPGGYLFLGTSESVSQFDDLFVPLDRKHRLFRARDDAPPPRLQLHAPAVRSMFAHNPPSLRGGIIATTPLRQAVETHVLDRYAPPHVVATTAGDIIYYSARTGKYFEAPAGVPNRQLLAMARKGLRLDLRSAFREAIEGAQSVTCEGVEFENDDGRIQQLSITVEPLAPSSDGQHFLVIFKDYGPTLTPEQARLRPHGGGDAGYEVERELRDTRERLQSLIEEYETAIEELKSSNEELVSVNEELQSTNEEMEASKEELQALNEELSTVNTELALKVEALDHANADLENLFDVTAVATIFLDANLIIRTFTPAATKVFKILPGDRGRPLTDLSTSLVFPELFEDLRHVVDTGEPIERQLEAVEHGQHYLARVTPYRGNDGQPSGVSVTVVDVSSLAEAESHQRVLIAELNHRVKNMLAVVAAVASRTKRNSTSIDGFYEAFSGRLGAMTRAYELLSSDSWREVQFTELASRELEPFGLERVQFTGDDLALSPKEALALGLVLHELATNAAKYGALSVDHGRLEVCAALKSDHHDGREVVWQEMDGPAVDRPDRNGFGMQLVQKEMSHNLRGNAEFDFGLQGLRVALRFGAPSETHP